MVVREIVYPKGHVLIEEGTSGNRMFIIVTGQVTAHKAGPDGKTIKIGTAGPGEVVGEMALIDGEPHSATVVALEDTVVAEMTRDDFFRYLDDADLLVRGIVESMARRIRTLGEMVVDGPK